MNLGITLPAMLKAAWVLTLRCFVSVENICFGNQEQIVVGNSTDHVAHLDDARTSSNLMLYIIRVDCLEAIQHFLQRLERSRNCVDVAASTDYVEEKKKEKNIGLSKRNCLITSAIQLSITMTMTTTMNTKMER